MINDFKQKPHALYIHTMNLTKHQEYINMSFQN